MISAQQYKFKIDEDKELNITIPCDVFTPTGTTDVLFNAAKNNINVAAKVVDLGCGSGVVGLSLFKTGKVASPLFASDLSNEAVECVKQNAIACNCPVVAKSGSLFEPWQGEKFDYIVNDISGVAQEVAQLSDWFKNVPCNSGVDGTDLVVEVIKKAPEYLNPQGRLFFPIISFSRKKKILEAAHNNFTDVERLAHQEWPLDKNMYQYLEVLRRIKKEGYIEFIEKFGMVIWFTEVYAAYNS